MLSGDCNCWTSIKDAGSQSPDIRQSTDSNNTIPSIWGVSFTGVCAPLIEGRQEALHMAIFIRPWCCRTHSWWTPAGSGRTCSHQLAVWWCSAISSEASGTGHWQTRLRDELVLCCAVATLTLLKFRLKWGVQCQIYKPSQRLSRCCIYKSIQGLILLWTRLTQAFIDKSQEHPLAGIFFPEIITCINMKYLWVTSENPSVLLLFICKCSSWERPQAGQAPLIFHQDLDPCLTLSVFVSPLLASMQKQVQNAIVGSWKHFHALLYCWKQLPKAGRKLRLDACWWSFLKQAGLSIIQSSSNKWPFDITIGRAEVSPAQLKIYESLDHDLKKKKKWTENYSVTNKITLTKLLASFQRRFKLFLSSSAIWLPFEVKRKEGSGTFLFKKKKPFSSLKIFFLDNCCLKF